MELIRYVRVLRRRLWMVVLVSVVAGVGAGIVSFVLPPTYEAQVVLLVRPAQPLASSDPTVVALTSDQISFTYASLMDERPLLETVIADLGLNIKPIDLAKKIKVTPEPNTTILDVSVQDTNPARARDTANRLVLDFIAEVKQIQQQETQVPTARSGDNLVVVSPAVLPDKPVFPNIPINVAIAFAAGLLVALGVAFLLDYLDQSIKSDEELTERLGLIPIAHIAFALPGKGQRAELVALDGQSPASEAYRALRTNLLFSTIDDNEVKTIVVTSSGPGEGKSRTAANLAVVLAHAGQKTLLIDADFRRPSVHKIFGKIRNVGLSNLAVQDVDEKAAISAVEYVPNLWLVTSGPIPPNPSELLGSGRVKELLARFKRDYAYVILDTPPVNAVTDAAILAAGVDGTILVVEQGRTTFPGLRHAKQLLDRVGAHTVGVVMNKVRASSGSYSYSYGYGIYASSPDGAMDSESQSPLVAVSDPRTQTPAAVPPEEPNVTASQSASGPAVDERYGSRSKSPSTSDVQTEPGVQSLSISALDQRNGSESVSSSVSAPDERLQSPSSTGSTSDATTDSAPHSTGSLISATLSPKNARRVPGRRSPLPPSRPNEG